MSKPVLYALDASPPVRAVYFTAREIGLEIDVKHINLLNKEHLDPEFLKINPQHTVPTLDDNGFYLWDSHTICTYLIGKYAKNDDLYPKDLQLRAIIDQRLHFDSGILFPRLRAVGFRIFFQNKFDFLPEHLDAINEAYELLEAILAANNDDFIAGNKITVADFSCGTTVSQMNKIVLPIDTVKYPKTIEWIKRLEEQLPYYEELNGKFISQCGIFFKNVMDKNRKAAEVEK